MEVDVAPRVIPGDLGKPAGNFGALYEDRPPDWTETPTIATMELGVCTLRDHLICQAVM